MLKPEAMQRTLILAAKAHQEAVIETLHALRAVHLVEFHENGSDEFAEFRIGKPLATGAPASDRLVRIRALLRQLGLEGTRAQRTFAIRDLEARLDADLETVSREVGAAIDAREDIRTKLADGKETESKLEPLRTLPLRLDDYRGYDTLTVIVGRADKEFAPAVSNAFPDALIVQGEGTVFAIFVPNAQAAAVTEILYRHGFGEVEVPAGSGSPDERVREIISERGAFEARLHKAEQDLDRLANEHRDFLLAADEHLSIVVEKAEAPLMFASTENAFVVDAWVPAVSVARVEEAVRTATGDAVHFIHLETEAHTGHEHGADHHEHHGGVDAKTVPKEDILARVDPPTKYANPNGVSRFQWFTSLFSVPRYNEIDPTTAFAIFFPLFFGFMIGDLGLGLMMVGLGWLLAKKLPRVDGMKQLGTAFMVAGIIAAAFGGFVFKDALGIPLGTNHHIEDKLFEEGIVASAITCNDIYVHAHEPTWACLLTGGSDSGAHVLMEPLVYKVTDVNTMLLLSTGAAFVHLFIGLLFGIRNEMGHGAKHVAAKFGYLVLLFTFFPAVVALLDAPFLLNLTGLAAAQAYMIAGGGFVVGAAILGWAEGFGGVLEIPSMFSAIMSYLRLGAVAIAKGAMAIAFNNLTLVAALTGGGFIFVLGLIGFVVAQLVLFVLGLLSGGIQALRLNFVEFFTKFYKGGGTAYKPFGRVREVTRPVGAGTSAVAVTTVLLTTNESS